MHHLDRCCMVVGFFLKLLRSLTSYTIIYINVVIIEKLYVDLLYLLEEIQKLLGVTLRLFSSKLMFPAFQT